MATDKEIDAALMYYNGTPNYRSQREAIAAALTAAEQVRGSEPEGHGTACYYCGEPCDSLAGNPGLWPIALCHKDAPGVVRWHHTQCVSERLIENQPTLVDD